MNLHKFFHGDEIFSFPCVLDSKDGILRRIPNVPSHNTIVAWAMGVRVLSNLAIFTKPKLGYDNDRMPATRRAWRQTAVCPYRRMFDVHIYPFIQTEGIPPQPFHSSAAPYFPRHRPSTPSLCRRNRPHDVRRGDRQSCTYGSCQSDPHTCT